MLVYSFSLWSVYSWCIIPSWVKKSSRWNICLEVNSAHFLGSWWWRCFPLSWLFIFRVMAPMFHHPLQYFLKKPSDFGHLSQSWGINMQVPLLLCCQQVQDKLVGMSHAQILPVIMIQNKFSVPHLVISCHRIMHFCYQFSFCLIKDIQSGRHFLLMCTHL